MASARPLLLCLALAPGLTACSDAMCDPGPVGDPWKPYEPLLPANAVVCGPNRVSARQPSDVKDDFPPTHVFVFYKDTNAGAAFNRTAERFSDAGWLLADFKTFTGGSSALFEAKFTKDGVEISIAIDVNDRGTQGSFSLTVPEAKK